ncbi:MAG TPA: 50S ribosomal protein L11 methyltransferase [Terriglobales bacterium]|nr:50S ribosomal protein L11 methyltransferase [Terriglobales bacterium]
MYNVFSYGAMMADKLRMAAYRRALERHVMPGSVVVDLGAGQGIFSFIACQLGAERVFAIELDDVINIARECAVANGFEERIEFFQKNSTEINLPQQADVIVSDLRGVLPFYSDHFRVLADARRRFLKPGGVVIPHSDRVFAAIVDGKDHRGKLLQGYNSTGFDFSSALHAACSEPWKMQVAPEQLISNVHEFCRIDYSTIETCDCRQILEFEVVVDGQGDGVLLWFDTETSPGIGFSTRPGNDTVYGQGLLPWPEAVSLQKGDLVRTSITVKQLGERPFWRWETKILRHEAIIRMFDQSSLGAQHLSLEKLNELRNRQGLLASFSGHQS